MGVIRKGVISIPIGRTDLIPKDYEIVDKRVCIEIPQFDFAYELRPSQQAVYEDLDDSSIINAWVSWGKTVTALAIAKQAETEDIIVTHSTTS